MWVAEGSVALVVVVALAESVVVGGAVAEREEGGKKAVAVGVRMTVVMVGKRRC